MRTQLHVKYAAIAIGMVITYQFLSIAQTGDPIIDTLSPIMSYLDEFLKFFAQILIPLGRIVTEALIGPTIEYLPGEEAGSMGFATYFIIFAMIIVASIYLNMIWKPRGWVKKEDIESKSEDSTTSKAGVSTSNDSDTGSTRQEDSMFE
ncbi:MAG: hypothetical protein ACTSVI_05735 [Promethearchaeota archaeon]